jgi:hypothetical protein
MNIMNNLQKIIIAVTAITIIVLLLTAPKQYYRYNPRVGHVYQDKPFLAAREQINYRIAMPGILSALVAGTALFLIVKNDKNKQK